MSNRPFVQYSTCEKRERLPPLVVGDDIIRDRDRDRDRPDIHGVIFLITRRQYEHMLVTEGDWGWQEYRNRSSYLEYGALRGR